MKTKQLTVWERACIVTGYGIGGGVLAMPYLSARNGVPMSLLILLAAFAASVILHCMIAELAIKSGDDAQIIAVFSKYVFAGRFRKALTMGFLWSWLWFCSPIWPPISPALLRF